MTTDERADAGADREARRVAALERARILDSLPEQTYDDIVSLASRVCDTPIALVSLVDSERQWFKAKIGLDIDETHRDFAFCSHAIDRPGATLEVADARLDARFANNPLVVGDPHVRFYAGAPIVTKHGDALGTVCVIDTKPRQLDAAQIDVLETLARHAAALIDLRELAVSATRGEGRLLDIADVLESQVVERTQERDRLWDLSEDLLVTTTYDGTLLRISPSWGRLLGYTSAALRSMRYRSLSHPDDAAAVDGLLKSARRTGKPVSFEDRIRDVHGDWHVIAWTLTPDPCDKQLFGIGRDVTQAKRDQEALATAETALRQAQKMEAVGQLTGGLAHDFNNLLTGITGSLELLQIRAAQGRFAELDRYVTAAQGAAKRAAALTHRLLAFARRQTLEAQPTDVNRLVTGLEEMIRRTIGPLHQLEVAGANGLWTALVDRNQLENALLNLCINARDAMPDGGRITIETSNEWLDSRAALDRDLPEGQFIVLGVTDTGTGMSPEVLKRAFDPFFTTKPLGAGTGLGLSMVYGFARQSDGQVRLQSEVGRGTSVRLYLPRHHGADEVPAQETRATINGEAGAEETILVVDDEPTVRMLIAEVLGELGYRSIEAQDAAGGLKVLLSDARIDLLITDVGLPGGMNGRQLADAARVARSGLKVLFVTGYAENAVMGNGQLDLGMRVLTKPFSIETLIRRVQDSLTDGAGD